MTNVGRLARLSLASAQQQVRSLSLPKQMAEAQEEFVSLLREGGATRDQIEAARLKCSAIFEMQLDLVVEAAETMRGIAEETGRVK